MSQHRIVYTRPQLIRRQEAVNPAFQIVNQAVRVQPQAKPQPLRSQPITPITPTTPRKQAVINYTRPAQLTHEAQAKVLALQGIGRGKILVILGNGPSLAEIATEQLRELRRVHTMSINHPDPRVWPTTYWAFCDLSQYNRHQEHWTNYQGTILTGSFLQHNRDGLIKFRALGGQGFSMNLVEGFYVGRSTVYANMQTAIWMDYDQIFILGCLPDGERILTNRGMVPIDALHEDDAVYTTQGFCLYNKYQRRWYNGILNSITTWMNNIPLRLTDEHPVLIERNYTHQFINASQLTIGDWCVYPIDQYENDDQHTTDFWWLVGAYAAEGYPREEGHNGQYLYATLCLGKHEHEFAEQIAIVAARELGCKVTSDQRDRPTAEFIINNAAFGAFVVKHVGRGSTEKFLSNYILTLPKRLQAAFVDGYGAGDGSIFTRTSRNTQECTFSTASESLAEGLQKLLLRLGVISSLIRSKRPSGFDRKCTGQYGIRHHLYVTGDQLNHLANWLRIPLVTSDGGTRYSYIRDNHLYVQIRKLTRLAYVGYVNNIEVLGSHTYGSRLIMTHNCDMAAAPDGRIWNYGTNPDVKPEQRVVRFEQEASYYDHAARSMPQYVRDRFHFCSSYNTWPFIQKYRHIRHEDAIAAILAVA